MQNTHKKKKIYNIYLLASQKQHESPLYTTKMKKNT